MSVNYLDATGATYLVGKIKEIAANKVDKVDGKGLSSNDYNAAAVAEVAKIENKVDKVSGKGLSTNDFTTALLNKLNGVASGAEVNVQADWNVTDSSSDAYIKNKPTIPSGVVVDSAMSDTSTNAIQNKVVKKYIDDNVASVYRPKGTITFANLPTSGMVIGDVYNISNAFTTTAIFEEGAGKQYPAGTNVVYDSNSKWDVLSGIVDLSGYLKAADMVAITNSEIDAMFA